MDQGEKPETALTTVDKGSTDLYERQYMGGEGVVLHREKNMAPRVLHFGMFGLMAAAVVGAVVGGAYLPAGLVATITFMIWAMFAVLRVSVSEGNVNIQYGVFGPKIPIAAIESAEAVDYDWKRFGGWGIRRSFDGEWMYNFVGDGGRAVRIRWRDAKGRERVTSIGSRSAEALAAAIGTARRALPSGTGTEEPAGQLPSGRS